RTTAAERASCPTGAERRRTSRRGALATDSGAPRASSELEFDVDEADDATVAPSRHWAVPCATDLGDMRRRGALSSSGRHPALVVLGLGLVLLAGIGSGCVTWEARELARERVPLSAGHLDELTPRHDAWGFRLELVETSRRWQRYIFRFETYDDSGGHHTVRGDWYAPEEAFEEPAPLLVLSP